MDDDFLFGMKFDFDPSGFIRGSEEAQDQLEKTLAAIVHTQRAAGESVNALAQSLSASPQEVKKALAELGKAEQQQAADQNRLQQHQSRLQAERHRAEMGMLRERQQGLNTLRDAMLSVAAISLGGRGIAGALSAITQTSDRGVSESLFAERTNTNVRTNVAEEEGAYLSGMSTREEARSSIAAYAGSRSEYQRTGHSGLTDALIRAGVQIDPSFFSRGHESAVSNVVSQLHGFGYNNQLIASILEQSGLTSGGYTNLALHPDQMRHFNQLGGQRADSIQTGLGRDLEFKQATARLFSDIDTFRADISHTLMPWVTELDKFAVKADDFVKKNPDLTKSIIEATAVAVALGGFALAITPVLKTIIGLTTMLRAGGFLVANPIAAAAGAVAVDAAIGKSLYDDVKFNATDAGHLQGNQLKMRDRRYGGSWYTPLQQAERKSQLTDYLINTKGYSPEAASAVAAMAEGESGFNELAIGDHGNAEGMFQWQPGRRKAVEKHFGRSISSMSWQEQADAFDWELHNSEAKAGNRLFSSKGLGDAVAAALSAERSADFIKNGTAGVDYQRRYGMAVSALGQVRYNQSKTSGAPAAINIHNMNVHSNDAHHFRETMQRVSMSPNAHAAVANSGQM